MKSPVYVMLGRYCQLILAYDRYIGTTLVMQFKSSIITFSNSWSAAVNFTVFSFVCSVSVYHLLHTVTWGCVIAVVSCQCAGITQLAR